MSRLAFPILYLNLGSEMLYIIDQRLSAQHVWSDRASKVMHEIIETMFKAEFIESVFATKHLDPKGALQGLFEKIAHSSIMKLNTASMAKLYDLMLMAVKYQICLSRSGTELLSVTLNHLYSIYDFVKTETHVKQCWQAVINNFIKVYEPLKPSQWTAIRRCLLNYFQDYSVRVSIFLKEDIQKQNGKFKYNLGGSLENGFELPGQIKLYDSCGNLRKVNKFLLTANEVYTVSDKKASTQISGDRLTKLGLNMYKNTKGIDTQHVVKKNMGMESKSDFDNFQSCPNSRHQLNLLSKLLSSKEEQSSNKFKLNLFKSDLEEKNASESMPVVVIEEPESNVIIVDATKARNNQALTNVMKDLDLGNNATSNCDYDLLDLMDQN